MRDAKGAVDLMDIGSSPRVVDRLNLSIYDVYSPGAGAQDICVAVLLATYNCERYVEQQIQSLAKNHTKFTLYWLDDHSVDGTRDTVRSAATQAKIDLVERHHPTHLGLPGTFFQLLDSVDADIYLFCDQDDIWQPGKIDAAVDNLTLDIKRPVLAFSDSILFYEDGSKPQCRLSDVVGKRKAEAALRSPPMFEFFSGAIAPGHTQAFTRSVRDTYLRHREIAQKYAFMHDWWMHDITIACGTVRMLMDAPTALWRQHSVSFCGGYTPAKSITQRWKRAQYWRQVVARHTRGIVLCTPTLPDGTHKDRLHRIGQLLSSIDRRQSLLQVLQMKRHRALPQHFSFAVIFAIACLISDAPDIEGSKPQ